MPRSKEQFKQITDQRRQSIYDAAVKLFAIKGYDSVSVDDITKASKCSHGLFYHYFNSKADLFTIVMNNIRQIWRDNTLKFDTYRDPIVIVKDASDFYLSFLNGDDYHAYILYLFLTFHLQKNLPEIPKTDIPPQERKYNSIPEVIEAGQKDGTFQEGDATELVRAYFACLQGLAYNRIFLGKKFKNISHDTLLNFFLKKA